MVKNIGGNAFKVQLLFNYNLPITEYMLIYDNILQQNERLLWNVYVILTNDKLNLASKAFPPNLGNFIILQISVTEVQFKLFKGE